MRGRDMKRRGGGRRERRKKLELDETGKTDFRKSE